MACCGPPQGQRDYDDWRYPRQLEWKRLITGEDVSLILEPVSMSFEATLLPSTTVEVPNPNHTRSAQQWFRSLPDDTARAIMQTRRSMMREQSISDAVMDMTPKPPCREPRPTADQVLDHLEAMQNYYTAMTGKRPPGAPPAGQQRPGTAGSRRRPGAYPGGVGMQQQRPGTAPPQGSGTRAVHQLGVKLGVSQPATQPLVDPRLQTHSNGLPPPVMLLIAQQQQQQQAGGLPGAFGSPVSMAGQQTQTQPQSRFASLVRSISPFKRGQQPQPQPGQAAAAAGPAVDPNAPWYKRVFRRGGTPGDGSDPAAVAAAAAAAAAGQVDPAAAAAAGGLATGLLPLQPLGPAQQLQQLQQPGVMPLDQQAQVMAQMQAQMAGLQLQQQQAAQQAAAARAAAAMLQPPPPFQQQQQQLTYQQQLQQQQQAQAQQVQAQQQAAQQLQNAAQQQQAYLQQQQAQLALQQQQQATAQAQAQAASAQNYQLQQQQQQQQQQAQAQAYQLQQQQQAQAQAYQQQQQQQQQQQAQALAYQQQQQQQQAQAQAYQQQQQQQQAQALAYQQQQQQQAQLALQQQQSVAASAAAIAAGQLQPPLMPPLPPPGQPQLQPMGGPPPSTLGLAPPMAPPLAPAPLRRPYPSDLGYGLDQEIETVSAALPPPGLPPAPPGARRTAALVNGATSSFGLDADVADAVAAPPPPLPLAPPPLGRPPPRGGGIIPGPAPLSYGGGLDDLPEEALDATATAAEQRLGLAPPPPLALQRPPPPPQLDIGADPFGSAGPAPRRIQRAPEAGGLGGVAEDVEEEFGLGADIGASQLGGGPLGGRPPGLPPARALASAAAAPGIDSFSFGGRGDSVGSIATPAKLQQAGGLPTPSKLPASRFGAAGASGGNGGLFADEF